MSIAKLASLLVLGTLGLAAAGGLAPSGSMALAGSGDHGAYFAPTLRYDANEGSLEVTFGIEEAARVSLVAFDAQGKVLATLLDGEQSSGYHHLSFFSNQLQGKDHRVIFQLRAGNSVLAEARPVVR